MLIQAFNVLNSKGIHRICGDSFKCESLLSSFKSANERLLLEIYESLTKGAIEASLNDKVSQLGKVGSMIYITLAVEKSLKGEDQKIYMDLVDNLYGNIFNIRESIWLNRDSSYSIKISDDFISKIKWARIYI